MGILAKFQCKNFLKFKNILVLINDSECKKRLHGVWTAWFIVKWFTIAAWLFMRSKQCLPKLTRLLCHCFVNSGFCQKTNFAYYKYNVEVLKFMEKKRKANKNIFKNCTVRQVNKSKNTADKQHSPWSWLLLTTFARSNKKTAFLFWRKSNWNFWSFLLNHFDLCKILQKD